MSTLLSNPSVTAKQTLAPFRLRRHADYQHVYKVSRKHHSASVSFFFRLRSPEEQPLVVGPRVGLTVGRVLGKAVDRNRIKRRMREAIRFNLSILHQAPPPRSSLDLVLHPRKSVATMEFTSLESEMARVFAQVVAMSAIPQPPPSPRPPKHAGRQRTPVSKITVSHL